MTTFPGNGAKHLFAKLRYIYLWKITPQYPDFSVNYSSDPRLWEIHHDTVGFENCYATVPCLDKMPKIPIKFRIPVYTSIFVSKMSLSCLKKKKNATSYCFKVHFQSFASIFKAFKAWH